MSCGRIKLFFPSFIGNRASVDEVATHVLSKHQPEAAAAAAAAASSASQGQACIARIAADAIFILDTANSDTVLSRFALTQIVHCADMTSKKPR